MPPVAPAAPPVAGALVVLTVNIHMGLDMLRRRTVLPRLRQAVAGTGADLVFLQEVQGQVRGDASALPQYEYLADRLWPRFAYGRNAVLADGHHGNALLSRYPVLQHANHDVSVAGHEGRGLLHCQVAMPGHARPLHAICVHLGLRASHRRHQLRRLVEVLAARIPADAAVVVAGDFNDWRGAAHPVLLQAGLTEVHQARHGRLARSFPARWPLLPLDRIYVRGLEVQSAAVLRGTPWAGLSDHLPLKARLRR